MLFPYLYRRRHRNISQSDTGESFRRAKTRPEEGYILLLLTLFVSLLAIAALASAPQVAQQIRREREEEMIHRGAQYARAIRKFVKKNGMYPTSLEQLENTNNVRYLRKRYKDPMSPNGEWHPLHLGEVPFLQAVAQTSQGGGQQSGQLGSQFGTQANSQMGQSLGQPSGQSTGGTNLMSGSSGAGVSILGSNQSSGQQPQQPMGLGQTGLTGSTSIMGGAGGLTGSTGSTGTTGLTGSTSPGGLSSQSSSSSRGPVFGGGAIVGVASSSEREGLKEFNNKKKYKEWYFVYDPTSEAANPTGAGLITGPYTGKSFSAASNIGTPAGQLASPNQPTGFGQPIGAGFGGTSPTSNPASPNSQSNQPGRR